jgi:ABC-2 type transport system permease protein
MKGYKQLTLAQLRIFLRNKQVLIWTLLFPIFLMMIFGSIFSDGNGVSLNIAIVDEDKSTSSEQLLNILEKQETLTITKLKKEEKAVANLEEGQHQIVIVIPEGYDEHLELKEEDKEPFKLKVFYDETELSVSQIGLAVVSGIIDSISKQQVDYKPIITTETIGIKAIELRYIDFLVPGIVALMILSNNMNGVAGQIASWRERGILRRMQGTPLKAPTFISAQITARLILNATQALIVLIIANLVFDVSVKGSWFTLIFFVILGTLTFMSIGFIIAAISKTAESAGPIAGFLSFPMMFLGGVFFPIKDMPEFLQPIIKAIPISHLSTAMREVMNVGSSLSSLGIEVLFLTGWLIFSFAAASYLFKWN